MELYEAFRDHDLLVSLLQALMLHTMSDREFEDMINRDIVEEAAGKVIASVDKLLHDIEPMRQG